MMKLAMFRTSSGPMFKKHGQQLEKVLNRNTQNASPQPLNTVYSDYYADVRQQREGEQTKELKLYRGASQSRPTYDGNSRSNTKNILKMIGHPVFLEGANSTKSAGNLQPKKFLRFKDLHLMNKRSVQKLEETNQLDAQFEQARHNKSTMKKFKHLWKA